MRTYTQTTGNHYHFLSDPEITYQLLPPQFSRSFLRPGGSIISMHAQMAAEHHSRQHRLLVPSPLHLIPQLAFPHQSILRCRPLLHTGQLFRFATFCRQYLDSAFQIKISWMLTISHYLANEERNSCLFSLDSAGIYPLHLHHPKCF